MNMTINSRRGWNSIVCLNLRLNVRLNLRLNVRRTSQWYLNPQSEESRILMTLCLVQDRRVNGACGSLRLPQRQSPAEARTNFPLWKSTVLYVIVCHYFGNATVNMGQGVFHVNATPKICQVLQNTTPRGLQVCNIGTHTKFKTFPFFNQFCKHQQHISQMISACNSRQSMPHTFIIICCQPATPITV